MTESSTPPWWGITRGQGWTFSLAAAAVRPLGGRTPRGREAAASIKFNGLQYSQRSPFFQRASAAALSNGDIRIYMGSGDRDQIKQSDGGTCGLANIDACLQEGLLGEREHNGVPRWLFTLRRRERTLCHGWALPSAGEAATAADRTQWRSTPLVRETELLGHVCGREPQTSPLHVEGTTQTYASTIYCDWGGSSDGGFS